MREEGRTKALYESGKKIGHNIGSVGMNEHRAKEEGRDKGLYRRHRIVNGVRRGHKSEAPKDDGIRLWL